MKTREEPKLFRLSVRRHGKWSYVKHMTGATYVFPRPMQFPDEQAARLCAEQKFPGLPASAFKVSRVEERRLA